MYDHNQIFVPDSFLALFAAPGRKPSAPRDIIERRYELCEDLANILIDHCRLMQQRDGLAEDIVLERCLQGLLVPDSSVQPNEAEWVVRRTAELLQWAWQSPSGQPSTSPTADEPD